EKSGAEERAPLRSAEETCEAVEGEEGHEGEEEGGVGEGGEAEAEELDPARSPVGEADEVGLGLLGHFEGASVEEMAHRVCVNPVVDDGIFVLGREDKEDDYPGGGDEHEVAQVFEGMDLWRRRCGRCRGLRSL